MRHTGCNLPSQPGVYSLRVYLIAILIAGSRLRRSSDFLCGVEPALRTGSTPHKKSLRGEAARAPSERGQGSGNQGHSSRQPG